MKKAMRFVDLLLRGDPDPSERQRQAAQKFPELVNASHMHLWSPGEPVHSQGLRLLLGLSASYAVNELELLDTIETALAAKGKPIWVDVLDVAQRSETDLLTAFPGIGKFSQTPILGVWSLGRQTDVLQGFHAGQWALEWITRS